MDISSAYSAHQAASVFASPSRQSRENRPEAQRGQGDSVSISDEAYAALEAWRQQAASTGASGMTSVAPGAKSAQVVLDDSLPAASPTSESKASLMDELREYIANPILKHALDQMDEVINKMGLAPAAEDAVREEIMAVFRSGIPAEGEQTSNAMNTLRKNLKKNVGLEDDVLGDLMEKVTAIVEDAQKKEKRAGKDEEDGQGDGNTANA